MKRVLLILGLLLLSGCTTKPTIYEFDITNCDPHERRNCVSVPGELISDMGVIVDELERLQAALKFCQKKL